MSDNTGLIIAVAGLGCCVSSSAACFAAYKLGYLCTWVPNVHFFFGGEAPAPAAEDTPAPDDTTTEDTTTEDTKGGKKACKKKCKG